jgi:hypothetical protein
MGKDSQEKDKSNGHHPHPVPDEEEPRPSGSLATTIAVKAIQTLVSNLLKLFFIRH